MRKTLLVLLLLVTAAVQAQVQLKDGHPDTYTVVKGDTLWDISGKFLSKPWKWPEIWHANPQVANPHLIYPGDRLSLVYIDGQPRIMLNRGASRGTICNHCGNPARVQASMLGSTLNKSRAHRLCALGGLLRCNCAQSLRLLLRFAPGRPSQNTLRPIKGLIQRYPEDWRPRRAG